MNRNIEVINDNLLMVNFTYINQGLIKELDPVKALDTDVLVALNRDGRILLNKLHPDSMGLAKWFKFVMTLPDKELVDDAAFKLFLAPKYPNILKLTDSVFHEYIKENQLDGFLATLNDVTNAEKERRRLEKEFKKKNRFKKVKKRFKPK